MRLQGSIVSRSALEFCLYCQCVLDVSVVAENDFIERSLLRKGMYGIDEQEMLCGFEVAMSRSAASKQEISLDETDDSQVILGLEPAELAQAMSSSDSVDAYWYIDTCLTQIQSSVEAIVQRSSSSTDSQSSGLTSLLRSVLTSSHKESVCHHCAVYCPKGQQYSAEGCGGL